MLEKLKDMFELQERLNCNTNGKNWKSGIAKNGKIINWNRCIHQEISEFIDSFPWKHWKDVEAKTDINNAHIELVDIWHFLMSEILRFNELFRLTEKYKIIPIEDIEKSALRGYKYQNENCDYEYIIRKAENLAAISLKHINDINYETYIFKFFDLCASIDLSFNKIYTLYIGKNALNEHRQKNGYKEGTYVKIWNGDEDNVVMMKVLECNPNITFEELLVNLQTIYNKYSKN